MNFFIGFVHLFISLVSIIIAGYALKVSFSQGETDKYYRNLQNEPIIIFSYNEHLDDPDFDFVGFELENRGPGYAIVSGSIAIIDPRGNRYEFVSIEQFLKNKPKSLRMWKNHGAMVFKPSEKKKFLWIESSEYDEKIHKQIKEDLSKITMAIGYGTLTGKYKLCFIGNNTGLMAMRKDTMTKLKADFRQQLESIKSSMGLMEIN